MAVSQAFVDADVIVRFLTGDDPQKQLASARLLERAEQGLVELHTPVTTIADVVHVLTSPRLYRLDRHEVSAMMVALLQAANIKIQNREAVIKALTLFGGSKLDFGDALIAASMLEADINMLYSYDRDFDKLEGLRRTEPK